MNKTSYNTQREAHKKALTKYRRKETVIRKIKELAKKADLNVNLLIEDKRYKKITQYYTHEQIKMENVMRRTHGHAGPAL